MDNASSNSRAGGAKRIIILGSAHPLVAVALLHTMSGSQENFYGKGITLASTRSHCNIQGFYFPEQHNFHQNLRRLILILRYK
jgi:hypothetical protein